MQVSVERRPGSVVELAIEVPAEQVERAIDRAFNQLAPRVRVPGFRPGKAPRPVIEREIGWPTLREQALEILVPDVVTEAVRANELSVIDTPQVEVETFERIGAARLKAVVTVKPDVQLGDYQAIKVPLAPVEVTPEQVDKSIEEIRDSLAQLVPAENRGAQDKDHLFVDLEVFKDGRALEDSKTDTLELDLDREALLPGLFDGLLGVIAGETREIKVNLPEDYRRVELAGQEATFKVSVKEIKERQLPAVDDELAKESGAGETLLDLRHKLEERLRLVAERDRVFEQQKSAIDQLVAASELDVPEVLVHEEIDRELRNLAMSLEQQGIDFDRFVQAGGLDMQKFHDERHDGAEERVKQELVLDALADKVGIDPSPEHVTAEAHRGLEGSEDADRLVTSDRVQAYVKERLRLQWALLWLAATARGAEWRPPTPEELGPQQATATDVLEQPLLESPAPLVDAQGRPLVAAAAGAHPEPVEVAPATAPDAGVADPEGMTEL
ncbi:MAG TPA: trigger factor [Candidatus Dormibacteraeota bacterium]|nr:trigger factor [Candidatus Dormibacteraeota bacterium]